MNNSIHHIIRFILLLGFQVLFLNNLQLSGYINPYVYILFVLLLPPKMPKALVLISGFLMGFTIDMFSDSYGIHTAATVLLAYTRPSILALVSVKGGEDLESIGIAQLRFGRFLTYTSISCFIHHFTLFFLEAFRWSEFLDTIGRTFISSVISLVFILLIESLRSNKRRR